MVILVGGAHLFSLPFGRQQQHTYTHTHVPYISTGRAFASMAIVIGHLLWPQPLCRLAHTPNSAATQECLLTRVLLCHVRDCATIIQVVERCEI